MDETGAGRYLAANRALWDEWTGVHVRSAFYDVAGWKAGRRPMRAFLLHELGDVNGKDVLHLQCHFGLDTLSLARLGARVTGVDFSARAVDAARELAAEAGLADRARFVCSDVLELPAALSGDFDVVFTTIGVLSWLPDLARWARVVAHYLRPGGFLYLADAHPFAQVFDDEADKLRLRYPYWEAPEPISWKVQGSYADPDATVTQEVEYAWTHSMGEIVTVLADAGLRIEFLHEFPFVVWKMLPFMVERPTPEGEREWRLPDDQQRFLPLLFSLKASKPTAAG
jgi:SAM-dependent methyltransferase